MTKVSEEPVFFLGEFDVFDPERAQDSTGSYAGELGLVGVSAGRLEIALRSVLENLALEGVKIKSIDFFGPMMEYEGDGSFYDLDLKEFERTSKLSGRMVFSDAVCYEG